MREVHRSVLPTRAGRSHFQATQAVPEMAQLNKCDIIFFFNTKNLITARRLDRQRDRDRDRPLAPVSRRTWTLGEAWIA
jgi:hypothetical protein